MSAFFEGTGPPKIIFYYQVPEMLNAEGDFVRQGEIPKLSLNTSDVSGDLSRTRQANVLGDCWFIATGSYWLASENGNLTCLPGKPSTLQGLASCEGKQAKHFIGLITGL